MLYIYTHTNMSYNLLLWDMYHTNIIHVIHIHTITNKSYNLSLWDMYHTNIIRVIHIHTITNKSCWSDMKCIMPCLRCTHTRHSHGGIQSSLRCTHTRPFPRDIVALPALYSHSAVPWWHPIIMSYAHPR